MLIWESSLQCSISHEKQKAIVNEYTNTRIFVTIAARAGTANSAAQTVRAAGTRHAPHYKKVEIAKGLAIN
jgi:hypothetical protein